jgi:uncharacterized membrane protein YphA (DoxX/SURF4 family)
MATHTATIDQRAHDPGASKALHYGLWAAQLALAAMFGMAGTMKLATPISELATMLPWVAGAPEALVRFIGASELAGAIGLVLPAALRIQPRLTVLAAAGLALVMVLAAAFHVSRGELAALPVNAGLLALAAFVAWGRTARAPIRARQS